MRWFGFAAMGLLVFASMAAAAPPDLKQVPADARWLVQIDVDAMRTSPGWKPAYEDFWKQNGPALAPLLQLVGLDPKDDLHGVTIFATRIGSKKSPEGYRGAAILTIDFDKKQLAAKLNSMAAKGATSHGSHPIYRWEASLEKGKQQHVCVALHSSTTLVVALAIGDVEQALDVLDGKGPNITQQDSPLTVAVPVGTLLLVRGLDIAKLADQVESPLLKQCQSLSLAIGEQDKQTFVDGQVRLTSDETAQQIEALANGLKALLQLQSANQDATAKLLGRLQCVRSGKLVSLSLRVPTCDLSAVLKGGKIEVNPATTVKIETGVTTSKKVDAKPGVDLKYNFGVQFGTQPPEGLPLPKQPAEKK